MATATLPVISIPPSGPASGSQNPNLSRPAPSDGGGCRASPDSPHVGNRTTLASGVSVANPTTPKAQPGLDRRMEMERHQRSTMGLNQLGKGGCWPPSHISQITVAAAETQVYFFTSPSASNEHPLAEKHLFLPPNRKIKEFKNLRI